MVTSPGSQIACAIIAGEVSNVDVEGEVFAAAVVASSIRPSIIVLVGSILVTTSRELTV